MGVIVPVRDPAPFLGETLDSILGQIPPPGQVVVVDDGSPVAVSLSSEHAGRCQLLRVDPGGPAHARAAGLGCLRTELVAFCDADDAWTPGSLELRVRALADEPTAAVCFGQALIVGPEGELTGERWDTLRPGLHAGPEFARWLFERNPIPTSSAVIRRPALEGQIDAGLGWAEDWDLWLRLAGQGAGFIYEPAAVVRYRRHPDGLTAQVSELARAQLQLHERHCGLVDEATARRVKAGDLVALAHGLIREGRYGEARRELGQAAALAPLSARGRLLDVALRLPLLRRRLGRRDPFR